MALVENVGRTPLPLEPKGTIEPGPTKRRNIDPTLPGNAALIRDRLLLVIDASQVPAMPDDTSAQRDRPLYVAQTLPPNVPAGSIFWQLDGSGKVAGEYIVGTDRSLSPSISQPSGAGDLDLDTVQALIDPAVAVEADARSAADTALQQGIDAEASARAAADAALQAAVDSAVSGLRWKRSVAAATTANVALTAQGSRTMDGVALSAGDRVLLVGQTAGAENGVYVVGSDFSLARADDADTAAELVNMAVLVRGGNTLANVAYTQTVSPVTVGTTALTYVRVAASVPSATNSVAGVVLLGAAGGAATYAAVDTLTGRVTTLEGAGGLASAYKGAWASGTAYAAGQLVNDSDDVYISVAPSTGHQPSLDVDGSYWSLFVASGADALPATQASLVRVVHVAALGSSYTLDLAGDKNVVLAGTLTADLALTITGLSEGASFLLDLTQDATGNRALNIVGRGPITLPFTAASTTSTLTGYSTDGGDFRLYAAAAPSPRATIQDEGISLPSRSKLNFKGASVTAADDALNDVTTVTVNTGSSLAMVTAADDAALTNASATAYVDGSALTLTVIPNGLLAVLLRATIRQINASLQVDFYDSANALLSTIGPTQVLSNTTATSIPYRTTEAAVAGRSLNSVPVIGGGFIYFEVPANAVKAIITTKFRASTDGTQGSASLRKLYAYPIGA